MKTLKITQARRSSRVMSASKKAVEGLSIEMITARYSARNARQVELAFILIKQWAESGEASSPHELDNGYRHPDPAEFQRTGGQSWFRQSNLQAFDVTSDDEDGPAEEKSMNLVKALKRTKLITPPYINAEGAACFTFTPLGAATFCRLGYPAVYRAQARKQALKEKVTTGVSPARLRA